MRKRDEWTAIPIKKVTRTKLKALGTKGERYDDVLLRLIRKYGEEDE